MITTTVPPLGLATVKLWTRDQFKESNALKKKANPTRMPIQGEESQRWLDNVRQSTALLARPENCVHIGDRECDTYELFFAAKETEARILIRTCVNCLAHDGNRIVADALAKSTVKGIYRIHGRDATGKDSVAVLSIKYERPPSWIDVSLKPLP